MEAREIAQREIEFKSLVREAFAFLVTEFGFDSATDESSAYRHRLIYKYPDTGQVVEVLNAIHGYDYGFEVNVHAPALGRSKEMIYYKLKEDQNPDLAFISEGAEALRIAMRGAAD
jgi:hypothetical protein